MLKRISLLFILSISSIFLKAQDTSIVIPQIEIIADTGYNFDPKKINQFDGLGNKHGYWKEYYANPNKKLRYEGQFNHGTPVYQFKHYYDNGVLKAGMTYFNEGKSAAAHLYHTNGKLMALGLYKDQKKDSLWKYYHSTGYLIAEEFYKNAQKHGTAKVFFEDGNILEESNWLNGKQNGVWKQYYYENGKPKFIINYKDGLRQGDAQFFYESGSLRGSGAYKNSHRDGVWIYYKEDGSLLRKVTYKDQKVIDTYEPEEIKKAREKEEQMMGDKKIEKVEDLDDQLKLLIEKY